MVQVSEQTQIEQVRGRLIRAFPDVPAEHVADVVDKAKLDFQRSTVRDFVPLLIERIAHSKLCREDGHSLLRPCLPDHIAGRHK